VDFGNGSFADLWVFPTAAQANDISDASGEDPDATKHWFWQHNRNIVLAIFADAHIPRNASTKAFDRCLEKA
jgi:hypothetical protein